MFSWLSSWLHFYFIFRKTFGLLITQYKRISKLKSISQLWKDSLSRLFPNLTDCWDVVCKVTSILSFTITPQPQICHFAANFNIWRPLSMFVGKWPANLSARSVRTPLNQKMIWRCLSFQRPPFLSTKKRLLVFFSPIVFHYLGTVNVSSDL